jgi:hypothetical protein
MRGIESENPYPYGENASLLLELYESPRDGVIPRDPDGKARGYEKAIAPPKKSFEIFLPSHDTFLISSLPGYCSGLTSEFARANHGIGIRDMMSTIIRDVARVLEKNIEKWKKIIE